MVPDRFKNLFQPFRGTGAKRVFTWLAALALLGGVIGAAVGWGVQARVNQEYQSAAVFSVRSIAPDMPFLSLNKGIEAEQTIDVLRAGPAERVAARAATARDSYRTAWVAGPKQGEVSFRISSTDAELAHRLATAVYAAADPTGRTLLAPAGPRPVVEPKEVTEATAKYTTGAKVIGISAFVGTGVAAGMYLGLVLTTAARRHEPSPGSVG